MDVTCLDQDVRFFALRSIADSTRRTYKSGLNKYLSFCHQYGILSPLPASESSLCYFVVALARQGLAPGTIKIYLAAVRHAQVVAGLPDIRATPLPRLQLVQNGVRREHAVHGPPQKVRLPMTPSLLRRLRSAWLNPPQPFDNVMLWAAASSCFFGFFRASEITVPTGSAFDTAVHLAWGDVAVDSLTHPSKVRFFLKRSKTDQFGRGVEVFVGVTGDEACPVQAVIAYVHRRGKAPGPFFRLQDGSALTKARFVEGVRQALLRCGVSPNGYSGHSFRIGAATAAAQMGVEDSTIQALGRWSSAAFLRYIRTPRDSLAAHSSSISRARSS